jgi:pimeloyl-ACP methyl ester carboxylesterase
MSLFRWVLVVAVLIAAGGILATVLALRETSRRTESLEKERSLFETRHGQIEYASWGEGPPVLVIHGAGGGFDQGRLLAKAMGGSGFRWIAPSRFGYLGSAMPAEPSTAAQADAFADLLDALGIDRVKILAMSGGVPPALKFAEMYPDRTDRMVLLSSAPFTPFSPDIENRPMPTWLYAALLGNDVVYWTLTKVARGGLERAFDARPDLRAELPMAEEAFIRDLVDTFLPASRRVAGVKNEGAAVDPRVTYDLEAIRAPVLVVHARDDRLNPVQVGETISTRIAGSQWVRFERGGHLLLGHHSEVSGRVARFFRAEGLNESTR